MYYIIDKKALYDRVFEEVSFVADAAYVEGGDSLYDSVILTEKDRPAVGRYIDDAVNSIVRRAFDICKYSPLIVYKQELSESTGLPLYYVVGQDGKPTTTRSTQESDFPVYTDEVESVTPRLLFHVPDFDERNEDAALAEVTNYIVLFACVQLFQDRRPSVNPQFIERAGAAFDKAIALLKTRKAPNEQW